jgi:hypothetical protein
MMLLTPCGSELFALGCIRFVMRYIESSMKLLCQLTACLVMLGLLVACDDGHKNVASAHQLPNFFTQKGDTYIITQGDTQLEVVASAAGRISSLKIAGQELLLTADIARTTVWGTTFWSSPQSDWYWPPIEILDSEPYSVSFEPERIVFTSNVDPQTGYQFVKSYGVNKNKKCLSIQYSIYNRSAVEKNVAAWEVTRVPPSGTVFFPQGDTEPSSGIFYPIDIEHIAGISWFTNDGKKHDENHHKLNTDSKEGWLAYANNGFLLIKEFEDVPVELMVAGEGEIEIFTNTIKTYMEIDQQSALHKLAPDQHLDWEVLWHTRKLPDTIKVMNGDDPLVKYVRGVLRGEN